MSDSIPKEEDLNFFAETIFSNVKLYLEERLQQLEPLFQEVQDIKTNLATLSSLLHEKGAFTGEEYRETFKKVQASFGTVNTDGEMDGSIKMILYNF